MFTIKDYRLLFHTKLIRCYPLDAFQEAALHKAPRHFGQNFHISSELADIYWVSSPWQTNVCHMEIASQGRKYFHKSETSS